MRIILMKDEVFTSNAYLVDAEKPVLIDTGGSISDEIIEAIPKLLGGLSLHAILFTHGHPDHIEGAGKISEHFGVPLFIHEAELDKVPSAQALGDEFACGDITFEVIHTPGHSPGGVCFYEPESHTLICGDTIFPGGRTGRWDLEGSDYHELVESVEKLTKLDISAFYPGHYEPVQEMSASHIRASLETLSIVGEIFDDVKYDERIESLQDQLPS